MPTLAMALVVACYAPAPESGSPCNVDTDCPSVFVCSPRMRCALPGTDLPSEDASIEPMLDSCLPRAEICGNGLDEDCDGNDPACIDNDGPAGAIDVTAGGVFTGSLQYATDDVLANGCGEDGGRDVFFRVVLNAPQVYYFDTFGSTYDTVIRVFRRSCDEVGTGPGVTACAIDACGGAQSQLALSLPAGESCIVIDQRDPSQPPGELALRVIRGGRDGLPLARGSRTSIGDTCDATNVTEPVDQNCDGPGTGGKEHAYFFTACPGETLRLDADTCPPPGWDPMLYVKRASGAQLACNDDACGLGARLTNIELANSLLYFLYIDGFHENECGPYALDTNLRP